MALEQDCGNSTANATVLHEAVHIFLPNISSQKILILAPALAFRLEYIKTAFGGPSVAMETP